MRRSILSLLALLLLAASGTGCSKGIQAPTIVSTGMQITDVTDIGIALDFVLELQNPNDKTLELEEILYTLDVNGEAVYIGRHSAKAALPVSGYRMLRVPAVVPTAMRPDRTQPVDVVLHGVVVYLAPGEISEILFDTGVRRPKVAFRIESVVPPGEVIDRAPGVPEPTPAISAVDDSAEG